MERNLSERKYVVYIHISPSKKRYIGITCQVPERRWSNGYGYISNQHFWNAIQKYGWSNFKHIIYKENLSQEEACELEKVLIKEYKTYLYEYGYNQDMGGIINKEFTEEAIKKMRDNHADFSGENHPFYGKHHTEETKEKLRKYKEELNHNSKKVKCKNTQEIFPCRNAAARAYNIKNPESIGRVCNGIRKTAGIHPETGERLSWEWVKV